MEAAPDPLQLAADGAPERPAVIVDGSGGAVESVTTYSELSDRASRLASGLAAIGGRPGERLVWCGPNSLEIAVTIHAARRAGMVAVPLSYRFNADEMRYVVDNSDGTVVVVDAEYAPLVAAVRDDLPKVRAFVAFPATQRAPALPDGFVALDTLGEGAPAPGAAPAAGAVGGAGATMIYTSGTTGRPKGAMRSGSDPGTVFALLAELGLRPGEEVYLTTGPLYHSGPLAFFALAHSLGGTVVMLRRFDARAWLRCVREHRVTNTFSAPTQLKRVVSLPEEELAGADCSSMRCLVANAAPVPFALKQEVIAKLGDGFLFEVYGSTELGIITVLPPADQLRKPGSCGRPYGGIRVRVVDESGRDVPAGTPGELFMASNLAMDGYHKSTERLAELAGSEDGAGGWKSVGDVAYVDGEGYVHICDRKKDMIISGGVNIYPAEIESVVYEHPLVLDAAVFGVPDDEWGERVHCIVQAKDGAELDLEELREFVDARVSAYMRPRAYEQRADLPRTDSGKLLKRVLRDEYWEGRARAV